MAMATDISFVRTQILANARVLIQANPTSDHAGLEIVVFGGTEVDAKLVSRFTAAVMIGLHPAIEGEEANNPEVAVRKLFLTTCELLLAFVPKVGAHQRNVHGGGVFDDDIISQELKDAKRKLG